MACFRPWSGLAGAVAPEEKLTGQPAFPWGTLAVGLMAVGLMVFPAVSGLMIYDRSLIFHGQVWRCWTGHVVHYGPSHFFWDLAVFLPAGIWLERLRPKTARWFYGICPLAISATLLAFEPSLIRYAGLSGLATGTLVLLAGVQLGRRNDEPAWLWLGVLALVGLKIAIELRTGAPLVVSDFAGIRTVPLAHISGVVCGILFWGFTRRSPSGASA